MKCPDLTVVIPVLNEADNIGQLISLLTKQYRDVKIIVADDGSADRTQEIVQAVKNRNVELLDRSDAAIHGITASVLDASRKIKTPYFIVMDGDLQHPPEKVGEIYKQLKAGMEIVIGTRRRVVGSWPLQRRIMSKTATLMARIRLGKRITDPVSGFFGVHTKLFVDVLRKRGSRFELRGYKVLFDLLKYMQDAPIGEILYVFGERHRGKSKIGTRHVLQFLKSLLRP